MSTLDKCNIDKTKTMMKKKKEKLVEEQERQRKDIISK